MAGFLIPAGTNSGTSPDEISRRRMLADMLAQQGMGEVRNPWEGLANVGISFLAGRQMRKADREERAGRKSGMDALIAALGGGGGQPSQGAINPEVIAALSTPGRSQTGGIGSDVPAAASGQAGQYRGAIAGIESAGSGDYSALGPVTKTGDRAYGKYQVMGANIPAWTKQALGREMTPEEFLADPRAQDATFDTIFGGYAAKSGPEGAARQWFTGSPTGTGSDQLGTSGDEYAQRFTAALKGSGMPQESVSTYDPSQGGGNNQAQIAALLGNEWIPPELQKFALDRLMPQEGDPFTLGEGDIRYDASGREIARGAPQEDKPPSAVQEYQFAVGQGFKGTFEQWEASKKGGMSLTVDPATGEVSFQQGPNIKPLTEGQSKDTVFATRASGALPILDTHGEALTNLGETVAGGIPLAGNYMKSPEFQQAEQAGKEFLQAILRKDTGAAITAEETAEYGSVYLPRPGDSKELLAQKKTSRQRAINAIEAGMPPQAILAKEKALAAEATPIADDGDLETPPADVDPELWKLLTPEERQQYLAAGQ